jgi:hypothetical protein
MKISELMERLNEAKERFGNLDVVVGEANSELRSRLSVNVDTAGKIDESRWDDKVCIVQAYVVFKPLSQT